MKKILLPLLLILAACREKPATPVTVLPDKAHGMVKAMGISLVTLNGLRRDSLGAEFFEGLFPVYAMPADTDLRNDQPPIKGRYGITDSAITFTPDTPFVTGRTYFARYYHYDDRITGIDLALHRREMGKPTYTELIFKY